MGQGRLARRTVYTIWTVPATSCAAAAVPLLRTLLGRAAPLASARRRSRRPPARGRRWWLPPWWPVAARRRQQGWMCLIRLMGERSEWSGASAAERYSLHASDGRRVQPPMAHAWRLDAHLEDDGLGQRGKVGAALAQQAVRWAQRIDQRRQLCGGRPGGGAWRALAGAGVGPDEGLPAATAAHAGSATCAASQHDPKHALGSAWRRNSQPARRLSGVKPTAPSGAASTSSAPAAAACPPPSSSSCGMPMSCGGARRLALAVEGVATEGGASEEASLLGPWLLPPAGAAAAAAAPAAGPLRRWLRRGSAPLIAAASRPE